MDEIKNIRKRWNEFRNNIDISKLPVPFTKHISSKLHEVEIYISYLEYEVIQRTQIKKELSKLSKSD